MSSKEDEKPDWVDALEKRLIDKIDKGIERIENKLAELEKRLIIDIEKPNLEKKNMSKKVTEVEQKVKELNEKTRGYDKCLLSQDVKNLELFLHFRGLTQDEEENTYQLMMEALAEFLEKPLEYVKDYVDVIYRINSSYAKFKNLPLDIMVQGTKRIFRDEILRKDFDNG